MRTVEEKLFVGSKVWKRKTNTLEGTNTVASCPERLLNQRSVSKKLKMATCVPSHSHMCFMTYCALERLACLRY